LRYLTTGFGWSLLVAFFIIFLVLSHAAVTAYRTVTPSEAEQTVKEIQAQAEKATAESIFINNFFASWTLFIPIVGIFPFLFVIYNTGWVIGLIGLVQDVYPTAIIQNLYTVMFVEFLAYIIALAENIYISYLTLTRGGAAERLPHTIKSYVLYVILLMVGAVMEAAMVVGG